MLSSMLGMLGASPTEGSADRSAASEDQQPSSFGRSASSSRPIMRTESEEHQMSTVAKRRGQIFEEDKQASSSDITRLLRDEAVQDPETQALLKEALSRFIGLGDATNPETALELVLRGMEREEFPRGSHLIRQGDHGSKLYVVESGEVEITIDGRYIRNMGRGSVIGELALLYDAPRSATVTSCTDTVLWSLRREIFKRINAVSSSALYTQRSRWLAASPHLACLNAIELPRLIATLQVHHFSPGEKLYREGELSDQCILIESGSAMVYCSRDLRDMPPSEVDKMFGIIRPKTKRNSVKSMNVTELSSFLSKTKMESISEDGDQDEGDAAHSNTPIDTEHIILEETQPKFLACEVYEGCLLGVGTLLGRGKLSGGWLWDEHRGGAAVPFTVQAHHPTSALVFTVSTFERLFGSVGSVINIGALGENRIDSPRSQQKANKEKMFTASSFEFKYVLGSGSFGTVVYSEAKEEDGMTHAYALKIFNKVDIIETGQVKHVTDERRLLALMNSIFILKLYGTYQTPNQIVMVTESLLNGDMWSVIYEPPFERVGLPRELVVFYIASIVLALAHIHERGLAYRDLKPENIMLDGKGYIRVIDFGFCKAIPYTKQDSHGEIKVYAKSYTLCGTPEYLAPEFVFNLGHDFSADLWALGITLYEMFLGATPFAPKKPDNITELFNNIAITKVAIHP